MLFVLGGLVGVHLFGETVASFEPFWLSSSMGRFTLPEWLGLSTGVTVLLVVLVALAAFWGAEALERRLGEGATAAGPAAPRRRLGRALGAAALVAAALLLALRGEPTPEQRWRWAPPAVHRLLEDHAYLANPAEVVALRQDTALQVEVLDLRSEHDFNLFHVGGARRVEPAALEQPAQLRRLLDQPASTITFLVGNDEAQALPTWRRLESRGVANLYAVEVNRWLELYPVPGCVAARAAGRGVGELGYRFAYATGQSLPSAWPELPTSREFRFPCASALSSGSEAEHEFRWPTPPFTKRVKLQIRSVVKGGCG
jgi:hypothetical protein